MLTYTNRKCVMNKSYYTHLALKRVKYPYDYSYMKALLASFCILPGNGSDKVTMAVVFPDTY